VTGLQGVAAEYALQTQLSSSRGRLDSSPSFLFPLRLL
jgi:hypothetical protein